MSRIRLIVESLLFAAAVTAVVIGWQVVRGMLTTVYETPDILNQYASVDYLEHKTSFGVIYESSIWYVIGGFLLIAALYAAIRLAWNSRKRKRSGN
ncbi:hypothetical protein [Paenibacillus pinihumi]|uniref:hypothetical protein n=1 Tax=Paenibacillus pinihumi TaxID=669462 RepID=UPI0003F7C308|nr:hypothetical protein [Paenibacillus pinihumi]